MVARVVSAAGSLRGLLRGVDVEALSGDECAGLAEELARVEKACAAVRAMAAARAADHGSYGGRGGFGNAEDWAASITGDTRSAARSDLATGSRLGDCPKTRDAAVEGEVSLGQADEITRTEAEKPGSEDDLVERARSGASRQALADECRKRRQAGMDLDALAARQRSLRSLRTWTDGDGMVCGRFRLEPALGVSILNRLGREAERLHREARRAGSTEPFEAHAADALVSMLGSGGEAKRRRTRADVVFVVDLRTYREGQHDDTVCHVVGGGPVAPDVVREMSKDGFLKVVFHDGVNVHTVTHLGRYIPAELRTALELGDPPELDGVACSGCGKRFGIQWDHLQPVCAGGVTSFANEDPKCFECHVRKSEEERAAGLYDRARAP